MLTVGSYLLLLLSLTLPMLLWSFGGWLPGQDSITLTESFQVYRSWGYWVWLGIMGLGLVVLLFSPAGALERRLTPRQPLLLPVLAAGFFLASLCLAGLLCLLCLGFDDRAYDLLGSLGGKLWSGVARVLVARQILRGPADTGETGLHFVFGFVTVLALLWIVWGAVFYHFAKGDEPGTLLQRTVRWLLRGSVLELLIAVPSHIIVRNRQDCCAPAGTFWAMTMGISIMLLCFGPGVFFLFAQRFGKLQPKTVSA